MRLIDGDRLEDAIEDECFNYISDSDFNVGIQNGLLLARDFVQEAPTIDAEPVKHGKWILTNKPNIYGGTTIKCSVCGYEGVVAHIEDHHYCWVCGARMDDDEISNIAKESADKISKALEKVRAKGMQKQNIKEDDKP